MLHASKKEFRILFAKVVGIFFKCNGSPGHGSLLLENTAGPKAQYILDRMLELRQSQVELLENNPEMTIGDVTTVNLTTLRGGVQSNVIPPQFTLGFDIRLALDVNMDDFEKQVGLPHCLLVICFKFFPFSALEMVRRKWIRCDL